MRSRAFRRHAEEKRKAWAKKKGREWYGKDPSPSQVGRLAHSPAICSCHMCGNPRRYWNQKTHQEVKADSALVDQLAESAASNTVRWEFESPQGYQDKDE